MRAGIPLLPIVVAAWFSFATTAATASELTGAWSLQQYVMQGDERSDVSGLLVMTEGRFGLIYTMSSKDGSLAGRAHSGDYRLEDGQLVFAVKWWPEDVDGAARAAPPATETAHAGLDGDELLLTFGSGSTQRWHRIDGNGLPAAAWQVEQVATNGCPSPAGGLFLSVGDRFTLVYESAGGEEGGVFAYGGTARAESGALRFNTEWLVNHIDGQGEVSNAGRAFGLTLSRPGTAVLSDTHGTIYRLRR